MLKVKLDTISILNEKEISDKILLENLDFSFERKNVYSLMGDNGSGKSTLTKTFAKLTENKRPNVSGKILLDDISILDLNKKELLEFRKKKIRYVFQEAITSFDPLKKLSYYINPFASNVEFLDLLQRFLLPDFDELKNLYSYQLSGGMAQRLSIILAFIAKPDIIVLDEPSSSLDISITNILVNYLNEYVKENNSIIIQITQDLSYAEHSSNYIGRIKNRTIGEFTQILKANNE